MFRGGFLFCYTDFYGISCAEGLEMSGTVDPVGSSVGDGDCQRYAGFFLCREQGAGV